MRTLLLAALAAQSFSALAADPETVTLAVGNMTCKLCPITVRKSLERVAGVSAVQVSFDAKTATVTYDPDKTGPESLARATTNAGYPASIRK